jgi:glycosyltransferase involved in cell wall biosynthesis
MIIGIDGNEANLLEKVGVGQYAFNLLTELSKLKSSHQYHIYLKKPPQPDMPPESNNWHYHVFGPQKMWTRFALPLYLYTHSPRLDYFYSPSHYSPFPCPCPTIPTIHDLGYLSTPEQFTKKDFYQLTRWTEQSLKKAKQIVAVSVFTKDEIVKIYNINPDKINVVYNGVGEPPQKIIKFINPPYFAYVGTLKPNKNLPFLITAFAKYLHSNALKHHSATAPKLVIAGKKGWLFNDIFATVKKEKNTDSVVFTDYITEEQKWSLYKSAIATIIPSLYEGFGIPAIESQKVGTPVIASNIKVFTEILGSSALFIDPTNIDSLVQALEKIQDKTTRNQLIKKSISTSSRFTWINSARSLQKLFDRL